MATELDTYKILKNGKCSGCNNSGEEYHTCPYSEEIYDDCTTLCNCCDECCRNCADDI